MSDSTDQLDKRITRLEVMLATVILYELQEGDDKFLGILRRVLGKYPPEYFDEFWNNYASFLGSDEQKGIKLGKLQEKLSHIEELFNDLRSSSEEIDQTIK